VIDARETLSNGSENAGARMGIEVCIVISLVAGHNQVASVTGQAD